jgi:hypothetical protein
MSRTGGVISGKRMSQRRLVCVQGAAAVAVAGQPAEAAACNGRGAGRLGATDEHLAVLLVGCNEQQPCIQVPGHVSRKERGNLAA